MTDEELVEILTKKQDLLYKMMENLNDRVKKLERPPYNNKDCSHKWDWENYACLHCGTKKADS
jgi:hypothetical protein